MLDFLDISLSLSDHHHRYLIFQFKGGTVADVTRYTSIDQVVAYCREHPVPVVSSSPLVRDQLGKYDIAAQPFEARAVGM